MSDTLDSLLRVGTIASQMYTAAAQQEYELYKMGIDQSMKIFESNMSSTADYTKYQSMAEQFVTKDLGDTYKVLKTNMARKAAQNYLYSVKQTALASAASKTREGMRVETIANADTIVAGMVQTTDLYDRDMASATAQAAYEKRTELFTSGVYSTIQDYAKAVDSDLVGIAKDRVFSIAKKMYDNGNYDMAFQLFSELSMDTEIEGQVVAGATIKDRNGREYTRNLSDDEIDDVRKRFETYLDTRERQSKAVFDQFDKTFNMEHTDYYGQASAAFAAGDYAKTVGITYSAIGLYQKKIKAAEEAGSLQEALALVPDAKVILSAIKDMRTLADIAQGKIPDVDDATSAKAFATFTQQIGAGVPVGVIRSAMGRAVTDKKLKLSAYNTLLDMMSFVDPTTAIANEMYQTGLGMIAPDKKIMWADAYIKKYRDLQQEGKLGQNEIQRESVNAANAVALKDKGKNWFADPNEVGKAVTAAMGTFKATQQYLESNAMPLFYTSKEVLPPNPAADKYNVQRGGTMLTEQQFTKWKADGVAAGKALSEDYRDYRSYKKMMESRYAVGNFIHQIGNNPLAYATDVENASILATKMMPSVLDAIQRSAGLQSPVKLAITGNSLSTATVIDGKLYKTVRVIYYNGTETAPDTKGNMQTKQVTYGVFAEPTNDGKYLPALYRVGVETQPDGNTKYVYQKIDVGF